MKNNIKYSLQKRMKGLQMSDSLQHSIRTQAAGGSKRHSLPRKKILRLALVLTLLAGTLTAFALTRGFGLFELMGTIMPHFSSVRPEAEELLRKDLAHYSFDHVDVTIREAAYDGRYLRVSYSVTDRAANAPLDEPGKSLTSDREDLFPFKAAVEDNIQWSTLDWALVDGHDVNPLGMSFSVAGPNNGEAITWVQFDVRELDLPDNFTVRLPIRGRETPKELDFTMDKAGMNHVFYLNPPPDKRIGDYVVHVHEVMVSPIRTYITLHLIIDPGHTPEEIWKIANPWGGLSLVLSDADGSNPLQITDTGVGAVDNMDWVRIELPNDGFDYKDVIVDPQKPVTMMVIPEFPSPENYPDAFRLGHSETDFIIIPFEKLDNPEQP